MTRAFGEAPVWVPVHTVLICDARPAMRQSLTRTAKHIHGAAEVDFVTDACGLIGAYGAKPADLVLIGLPPGTPDGIDATNRLLTQYPSANVIVYGSVRDTVLFTAAIARGAHGFLLWTTEPCQQPSTRAGARPIEKPRRTALPNPLSQVWPDPPTERELQVLQGISRGQTNREIGRDLFLSADTVKTHASRLFRRLGAHDRGHAVALAMRRGLVT